MTDSSGGPIRVIAAADSAYRSARSIVAAAAEPPAPVREQGDDLDKR
jgi:hypothetical protein